MARAGTIGRALVALALVTAVGGCGRLATPQDSFEGQTYLSQDVTVDGAQKPLVPASELRLSFEPGRVSTAAGCNTISGEGGITDGVLTITSIAQTQMACEPDLMAQERWWVEFLQGGPTAEPGDRSLTLTSGTTVVAMTAEDATPDLPLDGTLWQLDGIVEGDAASSVPAGLTSAMSITGGVMTVTVADCRSTSVKVQETGTTLTFDPEPFATSTCEGDAAALDAVVSDVYVGGQVQVLVSVNSLSVTGSGSSKLDYVG